MLMESKNLRVSAWQGEGVWRVLPTLPLLRLCLVFSGVLLEALLEGNATSLRTTVKLQVMSCSSGHPLHPFASQEAPQTSLSAVALTVAVLVEGVQDITFTLLHLHCATMQRCPPGTVVQQRQTTKGTACATQDI